MPPRPTTCSALGLELWQFIRAGRFDLLLLASALHLVLGVAAVAIGYMLARGLIGSPVEAHWVDLQDKSRSPGHMRPLTRVALTVARDVQGRVFRPFFRCVA